MAKKKRFYKLNCLVISVGNRILRKEWDEIYPEETFGGEEKELEKSGKIVQVTNSGKPVKKSEKKEPEKEEEPGGEETETETGAQKAETGELPEYEAVTAEEIKAKLDSLGVDHQGVDEKASLYELLKQAFK